MKLLQILKQLLKSRTFWINILSLVATILGVIPAKWTAMVLPILNVILRYLTTQSIQAL